MSPRGLLLAGVATSLLGVAAGAFGAHALSARLSGEMLAIFETGVRYQMYHGLALVALAAVAARWPDPLWGVAGALFAVGIVVFSGSLYPESCTAGRSGSERGVMTSTGSGDTHFYALGASGGPMSRVWWRS